MTLHAYRYTRIMGMVLTPVVMLTITILSLTPGENLSSTTWYPLIGDKGAHALAYTALGCFLQFALSGRHVPTSFTSMLKENGWRVPLVLGISIVLGTIIEIVQPFFGRSFEMLDIVAEVVGTLVGILFALICMGIALSLERRGGIHGDTDN